MEALNSKATSTTRPQVFKDERYMAATGKKWIHWMIEIRRVDAENMKHKDIAAMLEKKFKLSPWWAQNITVRFEQEIGRRMPGETCEGTYQANISKIMVGSVEEKFGEWI